MKIIVAAAFYILYGGVCFLVTGTDRKNLLGLRSYPEEVQSRVRSDPQLGQAVPKAKSTTAVLLGNFLLFTVVFSVLGLALKNVLNLNDYLSAFWYFLAFGEGLGLFDLLVIDLTWWRSTKRIRFSFLPEKKYYQDPKKHVQAFLRAMGYGDTSPDGALAFLRQRLAESPCFPHEIGVFLGYPLSDVIAFMRDGGRGCRCSGCWKAYTNECEAMRIFQRYKACRAAYQTLFRAGWPLERLTVRA